MFESTFKNFNINLYAVNERNVYSNGDLVRGEISFELTKETKINCITMSVNGLAYVHWSTGGGKKRNRRNYTAREEYINFKGYVMQGDTATGGPAKLQPGVHVYPFSYQLPQGQFPATFKGVYGHIAYSLTFGIDRPWHMTKDYKTVFNYGNHSFANSDGLLVPLAGTNSMTLCCLWCASGPISMTVRLERQGFVPGETATVICEFGNASSRTVTPKAALIQKQNFYMHNKAHRRSYSKTLASVKGLPLMPNSTEVSREMMLTIPADTTLTISNCVLIDVHYIIEVSLSARGAADLEVIFPIVICSSRVYAAPPQY